MKKNIKLETRLFYTDVTELFEIVKDDSMNAEDFTLQELKDIIDNLIATHGKEASIGVSLEGDEYSAEWSWIVSVEREETIDEYNVRIQREKDQLDREKKRIKEREQQEKKEYLRLKKKFETKNAKKVKN
jgi:hypothetical protein